jgi:hypothetical protein
MVPQFAKKSTSFYGTRRFITVFTVLLVRYTLYCYTCINQTRTPTCSNQKSRLPVALFCSIINITVITSNPVLPSVPTSAHLDPLRNMSLRWADCQNQLPLRTQEKTATFPNRLRPSGYYMYRQYNIQQFYLLPTQCIDVFCVYLRTNSDISLYNIN